MSAGQKAIRNPLGFSLDELWQARKARYHGLTLDEYKQMLGRQGGRCAICLRSSSTLCHDTGRVRGLLCFSCNSAIGLLQDDSEVIARAARYVN